ncbi:MAG: hypothetical protein SFV18_04430 [Bryobacteraceae bacterium]|nr:hypothetical protein [Bryobacteraceae bacterium]
MKRTTIMIDEEVYEEIRREAFLTKTTMADVIRKRLGDPRPKPRFSSSKGEFSGPSPIEKVIGIADVGGLTDNIDRDLYGI